MERIMARARQWRDMPGSIERAATWTIFAGVFWWLNVLVLKGSGALVLLITILSAR